MMQFRLDIESLRAVMTVAETGSVTRAAGRLNLTQSAISHRIKRLEDRIGRALFTRSEHGLELTEDGAQVLGYAERMVGVHDEAVAHFTRSDLIGRLRLGVTESIVGTAVARILARFAMIYPNVTLSTRVAHSMTLASWLAAGEIDIALMQLMGEPPRESDRVLWTDDLVWIQSEELQLDDADSIPFVTFHEHCFYREWAAERLSREGFSMRLVLSCPSVEGVTSAVRSGLGIALVDRRNVRPGVVECSIPLPAPPSVVNVARAGRGAHSSVEEALLDAVEAELAEAPVTGS